MDLGIRGRKAIVCAASKGLGRGLDAAVFPGLEIHLGLGSQGRERGPAGRMRFFCFAFLFLGPSRHDGLLVAFEHHRLSIRIRKAEAEVGCLEWHPTQGSARTA